MVSQGRDYVKPPPASLDRIGVLRYIDAKSRAALVATRLDGGAKAALFLFVL